MTPMHGGKHCQSCNKVVTDFTSMTDHELINYFRNGQATCGRFYNTQLDRIITAPPEPKKNLWMRIAFGVMALLGLTKESKAQKNADSVAAQLIVAPDGSYQSAVKKDSTVVFLDSNSKTMIEGTVTDPKGEPILNASVIITDKKGKQLAITGTDIDGKYSVELREAPGNKMVDILFVNQGQKATLTDVRVHSGNTARVNYRYSAATLTGEVLIIRREIRQPLLQPQGVHTTHVMTGRE